MVWGRCGVERDCSGNELTQLDLQEQSGLCVGGLGCWCAVWMKPAALLDSRFDWFERLL